MRYSGRICIMKNVIRCGLPNYFSFFLFTYNNTIISFLLLLLSLFSFTCVFNHFVFYRSFLARRLDGFYEKFCKLFFTKTVAV